MLEPLKVRQALRNCAIPKAPVCLSTRVRLMYIVHIIQSRFKVRIPNRQLHHIPILWLDIVRIVTNDDVADALNFALPIIMIVVSVYTKAFRC
jgi:hypothetical protein